MNKRKSTGKVQQVNTGDPYSLNFAAINRSNPRFKISNKVASESINQKNSSKDKINTNNINDNISKISKQLYNSKSITSSNGLKKFSIKKSIEDINFKTNGNFSANRYSYAIKSGKKKHDYSSRGASTDVLKKNKSEEFNITNQDTTSVHNEYINLQSNFALDTSPDPSRQKNNKTITKYSIRNHFIPENLKQHHSKRETQQDSYSKSITLNKQKVLSYNQSDKIKKDMQYSLSKMNDNKSRNFNDINLDQNIYNKDLTNRSSTKNNPNSSNNYKIKQYMTMDFRSNTDMYMTSKSPLMTSKDKKDINEDLSSRANQNNPLGNRQSSFHYLTSKKSGINKNTLASSGNINEMKKNSENNNSFVKNNNLIPGLSAIESNTNSQTTKRSHFISPQNFYATSNALSKRDGSRLDSDNKRDRNLAKKSFSKDFSKSRGQSPADNNTKRLISNNLDKNLITNNNNFVSTVNQRKHTDILQSKNKKNTDASHDTEINLYEQKISDTSEKNTKYKQSDSNMLQEINDKSNEKNKKSNYYNTQYNMLNQFPKEKSNDQLKIIQVNKNIKNNFYIKNILSKWKKVKIMWNGKSSDFPNVNNELKAIALLGKGSFATVYEAYDRRLKINVAVKVYEKKDLEQPERRVFVQNEVDIISNIEHKHIASYYRLLEDTKAIYIAQEIGGAISLSEFVRRCEDKKLKENDARIQFKQLVSAVRYIHNLKICHRDLKLTNILINEEGELKLIDFGFSTIANRQFKTYCGTPSYMSPELVKKIEYEGIAVDLWAMGVILYKMVTGDYPFGSEKDKYLNQRILACDLKMPSYVSVHCRNLIIACQQQNPEHRITGKEMERHPFVKGLGMKNTDTSNGELEGF